MDEVLPKPDWLRVKASNRPEVTLIRNKLREHGLQTVCDSSHCPNLCECWSKGSATFLILGDTCTRNCRFCAVKHGDPEGRWDQNEGKRLARTVAELGMEYVVVTSVTRDDIPDKGAEAFQLTICELRDLAPKCRIEVLVPDLGGDIMNVDRVVSARPDVFGHNIEVVKRLQETARDAKASFEGSLDVLRMAKRCDPAQVTKSSIMLGLGETDEEVLEVLEALYSADVDIVTLGQYLRPGTGNLPVRRYVSPQDFAHWREVAGTMGFAKVVAGPFVRSSYQAMEAFVSVRRETRC